MKENKTKENTTKNIPRNLNVKIPYRQYKIMQQVALDKDITLSALVRQVLEAKFKAN